MAKNLSFEFSFTNTSGTVPGTVTGVIDGLPNGTSHFLGHVTITSFPSALDVGISAPHDTAADLIPLDTFTVTSGAITDYQFEAVGPLPNPTYDFILATAVPGVHPLEILFKNFAIPGSIVESDSIIFRFHPSSIGT